MEVSVVHEFQLELQETWEFLPPLASRVSKDTCPQTSKVTKPYIFLIIQKTRESMTKILDVIGLVLIAVMGISFVGGLQPTIEPGLSPLFWGCAGSTLTIIMYRKMKRKQEEEKEKEEK